MSSAIVDYRTAQARQLDGKAQADEVVTEEDVADPKKLARLLTRLVADQAVARRRFDPRSITFTNIPFDASGTSKFRLRHRFGSTVKWSVVGWSGTSTGYDVAEDSETDGDTLVLVSNVAGVGAVCVEALG